jgi:Sec-independent protein translocase protein TatA
VGFGTEIFFFMALGVIVLGPRRLQALIGHVARAKARFEETTQALESQLAKEVDEKHSERPKSSSELSEDD